MIIAVVFIAVHDAGCDCKTRPLIASKGRCAARFVGCDILFRSAECVVHRRLHLVADCTKTTRVPVNKSQLCIKYRKVY